jgi:hypothetical protein
MNLQESLAALRALDLPPSRLAFLAAQLLDATEDDRRRLVYGARAEEAAAQDEAQDALREEYQWRDAYQRRAATQAPVAPQADPGRRRYVTDASTPEERPVTIRFVVPTKADVVRPVRRAEEISTKPKTPDRFARRTHGLPSTYNAGCRCDPCRDGYAEYRKKRQESFRPLTDSRSRTYKR